LEALAEEHNPDAQSDLPVEQRIFRQLL